MKSTYGVRIYEICTMEFKRNNLNKPRGAYEFDICITDLKQRLMLKNKYKAFK